MGYYSHGKTIISKGHVLPRHTFIHCEHGNYNFTCTT